MFDARAADPPTSPEQMRPLLHQLQDEGIWFTLATLCAFGLVLIQVIGQYRDPASAVIPCLTLYCFLGLAWWLRKLSNLAAVLTVVLGCTIVTLMLVTLAGMSAAIILLVLPVGLASLLMTIRDGAVTAALCTLLLIYAPPSLVSANSDLRCFTAIALWITVGLIWLTLRPLQTILKWSWSSYEQSHRLLEQSRDYQMELKQALEDLAQANSQLTRLNRMGQALQQEADDARRAKEEFVANVSHELRTPLNMIIGFSEMIVRAPQTYGGRVPSALLADLSVILRNSQHLSSLIDDVLDLSQIEARRMALTKERVSLADVIEAAAVAVRPLFDSKGLELKVEVSASLPLVFCDRTRIREVALNLLSNAGRFTENGGVQIQAWQEAGDVVVSVMDTGPGIATADLDKVFQPFQQLDASMARRFGGNGLGLSISKAFVELHGGKMWLQSQAGRGTTFFFRLPIDPATPFSREATFSLHPEWEYVQRSRPWRAPKVVVRPRLVVVEPGDALRRLVSRYLDGAEIVPVGTLPEALSELARVPAQALLVNDASVSQALRYLESVALPSGTPAIVCSVPEPRQASATLGIDEYLVKPIPRDRLLSTLDQMSIKGNTILVVDDEPEVRRLFQRMLASAQRGYRILEASDGQHALNILREQRPDLVLLDLAIPKMNGMQFLEARAQDPSLKAIPVIVISAKDPVAQPFASRALAVSRGGWLSAPQLLACIESLTEILGLTDRSDDPVPLGTPRA